MSHIIKTNDDGSIQVWFLYNGKASTIKKDTYERLMSKSKRILRNLSEQCHLHGETEPTPPELIAEECHIDGYQKGYHDALMDISKEFGVYDQIMDEVRRKENEEWDQMIKETVAKYKKKNKD